MREPAGIPEGRRGVVGDGDEGAAHPGRADTDGRVGLGARRSCGQQKTRRQDDGRAERRTHPRQLIVRVAGTAPLLVPNPYVPLGFWTPTGNFSGVLSY